MKTTSLTSCCPEERLKKRNQIFGFLEWITRQKIEGAEYLSKSK